MVVPMVKSSWSTRNISASFWVEPMSSGTLRKSPAAALAAVSEKMVTPSGDEQRKSFYNGGKPTIRDKAEGSITVAHSTGNGCLIGCKHALQLRCIGS
jgi:hypothetical protein